MFPLTDQLLRTIPVFALPSLPLSTSRRREPLSLCARIWDGPRMARRRSSPLPPVPPAWQSSSDLPSLLPPTASEKRWPRLSVPPRKAMSLCLRTHASTRRRPRTSPDSSRSSLPPLTSLSTTPLEPPTVPTPPPRVSPSSSPPLSLDSSLPRNSSTLTEPLPTASAPWPPLLEDPRSPPRSLSLTPSSTSARRSSLEEAWSSPSSRPRASMSEPPLSRTTLLRPPRRSWPRPRGLERRFFFPLILSLPMTFPRTPTHRLWPSMPFPMDGWVLITVPPLRPSRRRPSAHAGPSL
mmetsp:Transcript_17979/g.32597  ORF Transcript_17979/g.32597 Transcript_17979/m.32597 type:complete len:294 (-) Transcript_17979:445-1326(-)